MKIIDVPIPNKQYKVLIEEGILSKIDQYIDTNKDIVIISDDNIPKKYVDIIKPLLKNPITIFVPQGEQSKSMETAYSLINTLIEHKVTRSSILIALGGGVIGDLVGFVASIYMRGVDFVQIPTTLLSQIDSSIGGKVGVNAEKMKNAIGSFKQPILVLIDPTVLHTLDKRQISSGIAEMIKYSLIADKSLFKDLLVNDVFNDITSYITRCIMIKREIVLVDEFDYGKRQLLNFGHTIGHAIEQYSNYQLLHGEAIAVGMVKMSQDKDYLNDLLLILKKYNLPSSYDYDEEIIYNIISTDKKANGNKLNIILVESPGNGFIKEINVSDIKERI